jgi:hypothetical protein
MGQKNMSKKLDELPKEILHIFHERSFDQSYIEEKRDELIGPPRFPEMAFKSRWNISASVRIKARNIHASFQNHIRNY